MGIKYIFSTSVKSSAYVWTGLLTKLVTKMSLYIRFLTMVLNKIIVICLERTFSDGSQSIVVQNFIIITILSPI